MLPLIMIIITFVLWAYLLHRWIEIDQHPKSSQWHNIKCVTIIILLMLAWISTWTFAAHTYASPKFEGLIHPSPTLIKYRERQRITRIARIIGFDVEKQQSLADEYEGRMDEFLAELLREDQ